MTSAALPRLDAQSFRTQYRTNESDPLLGFYRPCLQSAITYDRAVGYFRSSIYLIVGPDMLDFARRGGKARLLCSPAITSEDVRSISHGYEARLRQTEAAILRELEELLSSDETAYRTRVLATLVASGCLEIKLAIRPGAEGLYHEKIGIFKDASSNAVSFLGSANETWNGWHKRGNHEAIEVFCSWQGTSDANRVAEHIAYFERLWAGTVAGIETIEFPEAARKVLTDARMKGDEEIDDQAILEVQPERRPLPHQIEAIRAWMLANRRGIFAHATGSGKTFLAITAVKPHLAEGLPALILVPSSLLLDQWADELRLEVPEAAILKCGAGNDAWHKANRLRSMSDANKALGPRIILSTMQSAASSKFTSQISAGDHLFVIADEVHQIGSHFCSNALSIDSGPRIGLSATPTRYGDPEGTTRILGYFGQIIEPPITLRDAIDAKRLVEYEYFPHAVRMTASEASAWKELTKKIGSAITRNEDGSANFSQRAKMLLIQRARIAKKASAKVDLAMAVIQQHFRFGQRWLVYCEDQDQLRDVVNELSRSGVQPVEYHSAAGAEKAATLDFFKASGGVLVAIRCLDEGIDIPTIDHALILASSQNPRQFIQRRGRVLRKSPGKYKAVIHDAIVVPVDIESEPEQTSLLKSEFLRAIEFAQSAINLSAGAELREIAIELGFEPDKVIEVGVETDDEAT